MRISDWSSDVCSSDLIEDIALGNAGESADGLGPGDDADRHLGDIAGDHRVLAGLADTDEAEAGDQQGARHRIEHDLLRLRLRIMALEIDRKSDVQGKSVSVRVDLGGRRNIKKKN